MQTWTEATSIAYNGPRAAREAGGKHDWSEQSSDQSYLTIGAIRLINGPTEFERGDEVAFYNLSEFSVKSMASSYLVFDCYAIVFVLFMLQGSLGL